VSAGKAQGVSAFMDTPITVIIPIYRDVDSQADLFELAYEGLI
jgi:hypothetical protein